MVEFPDVLIDIIAEYMLECEQSTLSVKFNDWYVVCVKIVSFGNVVFATLYGRDSPEADYMQYNNMDEVKYMMVNNADIVMDTLRDVIITAPMHKNDITYLNIYEDSNRIIPLESSTTEKRLYGKIKKY